MGMGLSSKLKKNGFLDFYPVDKYPEIAGLLSGFWILIQLFLDIYPLDPNPEIAGLISTKFFTVHV